MSKHSEGKHEPSDTDHESWGPDISQNLPAQSEERLALRFAERHAADLRYVAKWNRWYLWRHGRWEEDETLKVFDRVRVLCRETAASCNETRTVVQMTSAKTVAAVAQLSRSDPRLAASPDQWDADPWLLNTPGGTIDLRSGRMHGHRLEDYSTKATAIAPSGGCPTWLKVLQQVFNGNADLIAFFQRVAGYCLTGVTSEHALFFSYGTGGNGKSVLHNTLAGILGSYAVVAPMAMFTVTKGDRHPTDMAMLRGARLVVAQETEAGKRWDETKVKALTGGDPVTARFMRQDFFTFLPQFKLLMAGNHKPGLRGVDEAIRRRMHLCPFTVTISKEDRDPLLFEKLKAEWPGILAWMIKGCLLWQQQGLNPPTIVREATAQYLEDEDAVGRWLEECCEIDANAYASATRLFQSWKRWAEGTGEFVGTLKGLGQSIDGRGFKRDRKAKSRGFRGLRVAGPSPR